MQLNNEYNHLNAIDKTKQEKAQQHQQKKGIPWILFTYYDKHTYV